MKQQISDKPSEAMGNYARTEVQKLMWKRDKENIYSCFIGPKQLHLNEIYETGCTLYVSCYQDGN